jgi:hypothetical protein
MVNTYKRIMMEHDKNTINGDSFLYIFVEEGYEAESSPYFKIGIVSHAVTDDKVRTWKKYQNSPYPPSIERRISKLNNGNPRQIKPLAYFRFSTDDRGTGLQKSRAVETRWKRNLKYGMNSADRKTASTEWFRIDISTLTTIIETIIKHECGNYAMHWIEEQNTTIWK